MREEAKQRSLFPLGRPRASRSCPRSRPCVPGAVRAAWPPATSKSKPLPAGRLLEVREVAHFQSLRGPLRDLGRGAHRLCAPVSSGGCSAGPELHPTLRPCRPSLPRDFCLCFHSVPSPANCVAGFGFPICEEALKTRVPGDSQRARGGETGTHGQRGSAGRAGEVLEITAPPKCGCV